MILYFSSTGNSKHVCEKISKTFKEKMMSIEECLKNNKYRFDLKEGEMFGIVTPVYFFGLPSIVLNYIDALEIPNSCYHFCCLTYGTTSGFAMKQLESIFNSKKSSLEGKFGIKMVDSYTLMFNVNDNNKNQKILKYAEKSLDKIIFKIKTKSNCSYGLRKCPSFISKYFYKNYERKRLCSHFKVMNYCIGCFKCIKNCPEHAIEMQDDKVVWIKERCTLCLRCLHHCPKFAIQYNKKTNKNGQYDFNKYTKEKDKF